MPATTRNKTHQLSKDRPERQVTATTSSLYSKPPRKSVVTDTPHLDEVVRVMAPSSKVTQRSVADVRQLTEWLTSLEERGQVHVRKTQLLWELHQWLVQVDGAPPPSSSSGSSHSGNWQRSDRGPFPNNWPWAPSSSEREVDFLTQPRTSR